MYALNLVASREGDLGEREHRASPKRSARLDRVIESMYACRNQTGALTASTNRHAASQRLSRRLQSQRRAPRWPAAARQKTFQRCPEGRRTSPRSYVGPIHMANSSPWKFVMTGVETISCTSAPTCSSSTVLPRRIWCRNRQRERYGRGTGAREERFRWVLHKRPSGPLAWTGPAPVCLGRPLNAYTVVCNQWSRVYLYT